MDYNDELDFDNPDDLLGEEDNQLPSGEEPDDKEGSEQQGRGDIRVALRKEREEARRLREQLAQQAKDLERERAWNQQVQQRRQEPPVDREAMRQRLADSLLDRPDEVFDQHSQRLIAQMQQMNAPVYVRAAMSEASDDPEFGDLYKNRPGFKKAMDAWISNSIQVHGQIDREAMKETGKYLADIARESGSAPSNRAAKDKLSSIADKSGNQAGRKGAEQIWEEKSKLKNREYQKWADSPEGVRTLNELMKAQG